MERKYLIAPEGNFYKANLHAHSTESDGSFTPEQGKAHYKAHGYQIYAYTDHNVLNYFKELNDPDFLVLCGFELDTTYKDGPWGFWKTCHINAISRDPENAVFIPKATEYTPAAINRVIQTLRDKNYIVNYNHPGWSAEESCDYLPLEGITAMEIYNHSCEVIRADGDARLHYDIMLKHGKKLYCIATDDNHNRLSDPNYCDDSCGGWIMIKTEKLEYGAVIDAIDNGQFYASTGPEIYAYYVENNKLCIDCSPVQRILARSGFINGEGGRHAEGDSLTHFELDLGTLRQKTPYIYFELSDTNLRRAWTNPYYIGE